MNDHEKFLADLDQWVKETNDWLDAMVKYNSPSALVPVVAVQSQMKKIPKLKKKKKFMIECPFHGEVDDAGKGDCPKCGNIGRRVK